MLFFRQPAMLGRRQISYYEFGMVKIALTDIRNKRLIPESENLGLAALAHHLRNHGVQVSLTSVDSSRPIVEQLSAIDMDAQIYGFPLFHSTISCAEKLMRLIKKENRRAVICAGSRWATQSPEQIISRCPLLDMVVLGYGEGPMLEIAKAYPDMDRVNGIDNVFTRGHSATLSRRKRLEISATARDLMFSSHGRANTTARLYAKKGCTRNCAFCLVNTKRQRAIKKFVGKDIDHLFSEIEALHREHGIKSFMLHDCPFDDAGVLGADRLNRFCDLAISFPENLSFECMIDGKFVTQSLVKKMKQAGFDIVMFLLGSGNEEDMFAIKRQSGFERRKKVLSLFDKNDIETTLEFFMFNPLSTRASALASFQFLIERGAYRLGDFVRRAPVYEGTRLHQSASKLGLLKPEYSYRKPFAYSCIDPDLEQTTAFFNRTEDSSQIFYLDSGFQNTVYFYSYMRRLFPESTTGLWPELQQLKRKIHDTIRQYLRAFFEDRQSEEAQERFGVFEDEMEGLYNHGKSLQIKLLRQPDVRAYILRR